MKFGEEENDRQQQEMRISMLTAIMKWVSIAILLLGFFENLPVGSQEWSVRNGGYLELFNMLVCLSALLVVAEGFRGHKYFWASGFVAIAVLFNPILPVALSRKMFLGLDSVCILTFLVSLALSRGQPLLTVPSISDGRLRSESL
jgi:uncharacterized protein DUF6804